MMHRSLARTSVSRVSAIPCLVLALSLPLLAQERTGKYGIGVTISPTAVFVDGGSSAGILPVGLNNLIISIRPNDALMIEPEIGLLRTTATSSSGGSSSKSTFTDTRLGLGLLFRGKERDNLEPYVGPRVGVLRTSTEDQTTGSFSSPKQTTTRSSWYFTAAAGAHYFFSRHFTLGGEVQLTKISQGEEKQTPTPSFAGSDKQSFLSTSGVAILRWYF